MAVGGGSSIDLAKGAAREVAEAAALAEPKVIRALEDRPLRRAIVIPDKIVNLVV